MRVPDGGAPDAGAPDAGAPGTGAPDAGPPDAGAPGTGAPGTGTGPDTVDALVLDLLEWIGSGPRPYDEVLEAWRTSCPRLPVWEEAKARGLVIERAGPAGAGRTVAVSPAGSEHLRRHRALPQTEAHRP